MLFNSVHFLWFFVLVYGAYWLLRRRHRAQTGLLLVASYFFYGYWDWRFLSLIAGSTVIDYFCGLAMERAPSGSRRRRAILILSLVTNLGLLGFFKYFNFFLGSLDAVLRGAGLGGVGPGLSIILPVGISFYTFQTLSYTIDRYRGEVSVERDPLRFALFVSFFPQLVAGPIVRASDFLPQLQQRRAFEPSQQVQGLQLVLWGLFKKAVVADQLAPFVNGTFGAEGSLGIFTRLLAVYAFAMQIYCDFSGYTDIARGTAKLLGFEFPFNFVRPYFARDPSAFWRRWHVSLSTWLRDYLYIPLGGNRGGGARTYVNLTLTMVLGGLWHGAAWNFVLWGVYQGLLLAVHRFWRERVPAPRERSRARVIAEWVVFFHLVCFGWLLFRAASFEQIVRFCSPGGGLFGGVALGGALLQGMVIGAAATAVVVVWDLIHERWKFDELPLERSGVGVQVTACALLYVAITFFGRFVQDEFIYFQF